MNQNELASQVSGLSQAVVDDKRWTNETLDVAVLGMLLYGYALAVGRMVMMLDIEDIDAAVQRCFTDTVGAAGKWSEGLVAEASLSASDKAHHPGNHELIGVGHSYFGVKDRRLVVDNIFANMASVRSRAG
ncbi:hypothetical protein IGB42_02730 [Andreprevotia sp. IGB-42]|uniref:hypothetical protein n=1 Tax=Andreprevotia sp. IGB-42 TaxID=2497473 RepID=UPI001357D007|nr:hypothetical protein [Andreprevotia sp. IGB-42]KAF0812886.1 hypothetical protein IGB42_02730 [Andreprevotia sp. IGB-42]